MSYEIKFLKAKAVKPKSVGDEFEPTEIYIPLSEVFAFIPSNNKYKALINEDYLEKLKAKNIKSIEIEISKEILEKMFG